MTLAQEGNIGLLKAVDRYDWRRDFASRPARHLVGPTTDQPVRRRQGQDHPPAGPHLREAPARGAHYPGLRHSHWPRTDLAELAERVEMPSHKLAALLRIAPEPSSIEEEAVDGMIAIDARDAYAPPDPADVVDEIQLNQAVDRYISLLSTKDRRKSASCGCTSASGSTRR